MTSTLRRALVGLVLATASTLGGAAGWGAVLRDSPAVDFTDEDVRQFLEAARAALDAPEPPQPVEWGNAGTGAGGSFLVLGPAKVQNFDQCRRLRIAMHSRKQKGYAMTWTACRDADGRWGLAGVG